MDATDKKVQIDYKNIFEYVKDTPEYLFVDKAEVIPGLESWGQKNASSQDWYFHIHFPGNPVMPGVFVMESIMTTGSLIIYTMSGNKDIQLLFNGCQNMRMFKEVRPGTVLKTHATLRRFRHGIGQFSGEAYADGDLACKMEFTLVAPEAFDK